MLSFLSQFAQGLSDGSDSGLLISSNPTTSDPASAAAIFGVTFGMILVFLVVYLIVSISLYKIFQKAGRTKDAWAGFVPVYQNWVLYEIAGRPGWWALLYLIPIAGPIVGLVISIIALIDVAKSFGKGVGYALLLIFLPIIGFPMLAFGNAAYQGPAGPEGAPQPPTAPTPPASTPPTPTPQPPVVS